MKKIHTRTKRRYGLNTTRGHYFFFHPKEGTNRPRTFKTEDAAHAYASKQGMKKEQYTLKKVKKDKKFQIVVNHGKN